MAVEYSFVYNLQRAYKDGNLLINKRVCGGEVKDFLDIPNSYKQVIYDEKGKARKFQYIEWSLPFWLKFFPTSFFLMRQKWWEKILTNYFQKIEREIFEGKLLPIKEEEIEYWNTYWNVQVYLLKECTLKSCGVVITPKRESVIVGLENKGKPVPDSFQLFLKPLGYF
jgi:hypothetical protein